MKSIILILLFPLFLSAKYLVVSSTPIGNITSDMSRVNNIAQYFGQNFMNDDMIIVNNIAQSFDQNFVIGSGSQTKEFPIYMKSNSKKAVKLKISNFSPLRNGTNTIDVSLYYKNINGTYGQLYDGESISILGARDGNSIVGYIKVVTSDISNTQTFGNYSLSNSVSVALGSSWSTNAHFQIDANVPLVAVAGLTPTNAYTTGKKFLASTVDFNNFSFAVNSKEKPLYIKSNSSNQFRITFASTPDLFLDGTDDRYKINMKYYYKKGTDSYRQIHAGSSFNAITGKSSGVDAVGTMKFETEAITTDKIAGEYSTSIAVTISAQ